LRRARRMCEPKKPLAPVRRTFCGIVLFGMEFERGAGSLEILV
jgi:hypothetical protein